MEMCLKRWKISIPGGEVSGFPVVLKVTIDRVPGAVASRNGVYQNSPHEFEVELTSEYPYQKPVVRWLTDIFHPNIMHPSEGGRVCTRLLDCWKFNSTLSGFISGIEGLLANPNPKCPQDSASCTKAAEYLNKQ